MMAFLSKLFLGPMLKVWIGGILIAGAYFGVKAGLSWFESRVSEYEQVRIENASLRSSLAFLEAQREKDRRVLEKQERRLQDLSEALRAYEHEPISKEHEDWQSRTYPGADRLRKLTDSLDKISDSGSPEAPDDD